jgi:hypothetical protein
MLSAYPFRPGAAVWESRPRDPRRRSRTAPCRAILSAWDRQPLRNCRAECASPCALRIRSTAWRRARPRPAARASDSWPELRRKSADRLPLRTTPGRCNLRPPERGPTTPDSPPSGPGRASFPLAKADGPRPERGRSPRRAGSCRRTPAPWRAPAGRPRFPACALRSPRNSRHNIRRCRRAIPPAKSSLRDSGQIPPRELAWCSPTSSRPASISGTARSTAPARHAQNRQADRSD